jgi:nanoRNase/pAp phosphatase (c-di-AMP/oligoRNAs hydrolase)
MSQSIDLKPVQSAMSTSQDILICIGQDPDYDAVAAALSLYLIFKNHQKSVEITCSSPMIVEYSRLIGLDKISQEVGNKNLVVSFDYIQDSIEKVNYHVKGDKFNLVIQPKKGSKPLDSKNVTFTYQGIQADMIFILGAQSFEDINHVYEPNQKVFKEAYTISLNHTLDIPFAQTSISNQDASSLSEITSWFIKELELTHTQDSASNLLAGIDQATNRFSAPSTPSSAFIAAAELLEQGATRQTKPIERPKNPNIPLPIKIQSESLVKPMPVEISKDISPEENQIDQEEDQQEDTTKPAPKDWLEPKIFHGSTKI